MKSITFFLGAGFSKAAGYPLGYEINEKLERSIKLSCFGSLTSVAKYLLDEYKQENHGDFDYEGFYDLIISYGLNVNVNPVSVEKKQKFRMKFDNILGNLIDPIMKIESTYNTKLLKIFTKIEKKENYFNYLDFINFIKYLQKYDYKINIFSLNHDRLIENLFKKNKILYSDGFEYESIRYQYKLNKNRISWRNFYHYTSDFKNKVRLFKLHGSIDLYYISARKKDNYIYLKPENDEKPYEIFDGRIKNLNLENKFDTHPIPHFLTGKNSKCWYKNNNSYFKEIFNLFEEELENTDSLIFIGYSFRDGYIDDKYLKDVIKKENTHIINLNFESKFLEKHSGFNKINKAFENVSFAEYMGLLPKSEGK